MIHTEVIPLALMALIGLVFSAFFSGTETGVYTLNRIRLARRAARGEREARILRNEMAHPNRLLGTLLLGNNIANYVGSLGIAALLDAAGYRDWSAIIINALVLTPVLFVFGETLPKDLFRTNTDRWTYHAAPALIVLRWLFTGTLLLPLVLGVGRVVGRLLRIDSSRPLAARQRISQLIKEGVGAGMLSEGQVALADRALRMRTLCVEDEMVPWSRVVRIAIDMTPADRAALLRRTNLTRLPVVDASGAVMGVMSTLDAVLDPERSTRELMYERNDLPADLAVVTALRTMRERQRKFAIVTDPRNPALVRGIVTLKDLVEPLTGELAAW